MKIQFVLPRPFLVPSGGYRIVYEYAERLAKRGHDVTVYHSVLLPGWNFSNEQLVSFLFAFLRQDWPQPFLPEWFSQKPAFRCEVIPEIQDKYVRDADVTIATAWATAKPVAELAASKGKKAYLIQGEESIGGTPPQIVHDTYRLGMANIVVSKWLGELLQEKSAPVAAYIPNGIDFSRFRRIKPRQERNPYAVGMMFHSVPWKGGRDGLQALQIAKRRFPELTATLISTEEKPQGLPEWVEYVQNPPQAELVRLYNEQSVFISSSVNEGFGLPGAEALACGCALATTDSKGIREYAIHEQTALVSPPNAPKELAEQVIRLLEDRKLQEQLAQQGYEAVQTLTWERALRGLQKLLQELVPPYNAQWQHDWERLQQREPAFTLPIDSLQDLVAQAKNLPLAVAAEQPQVIDGFFAIGLEYRRRFIEKYLLEQCQQKVQHGPFKDMTYFIQPMDKHYCPKILGTYEQELQELLQQCYFADQFIFADSTDSYEAVGAARLWPVATVLSFVSDKNSLRASNYLKTLNDVADRLTVAEGMMTEQHLTSDQTGQRVLIIRTAAMLAQLLQTIPQSDWQGLYILCKMPPHQQENLTNVFLQVFQKSHRIQFVWPKSRTIEDIKVLQNFSEIDTFVALREERGTEPWALLEPLV